MSRTTSRRGSLEIAGLFLVLTTAAGCSDADESVPLAPSARLEETGVVVEVTQPSVGAGEIFTVAVRLDAADRAALGGLQGTLRWDPDRFRYAGQMPEAGRLVVVNSDAEGEGALRILVADPLGLDGRAAAFAFRAIAGGSTDVRFEPEWVVDQDQRPRRFTVARAILAPDLPSPGLSRRMSGRDWAEFLDPGLLRREIGPLRSPGGGTVFGDVTQDGTVNVLDVLYLANASVGNAEIIVGTNSPSRDAVHAGNTRPANLPGLGEGGDTCPPGLDACGGVARSINVLDVLATARESVGLDEAIVGQAIPRATANDTVLLGGPITTARVLTSDSVYVLASTVTVQGGGSLSASAGTRILGSAGAALVIGRDGSMEIQGSVLDPVILGCRGASPKRGCWKGLVVLGNAYVNRGSIGPSGCLEALDDPREGLFGGCAPGDDRGSLQYARIEFATRGVELLGVGSGTIVENVQVHASETAGLTISGGQVDVRRLLVTAAGGNALRWRDGWTGRAQHLLLQLDPVAGNSAILGRNNAASPLSTPFSRPTIYNATVVGVTLGSTSGAAVELRDGTGAEIRNLLSLTVPVGLDIDGGETCARVPVDIVLRNWLVAGSDEPGDADPDPGCPGATHESALLGTTLYGHTIVTNGQAVSDLLKGALDAFIPDFRPSPGGAASALSGSVPPADGFFETSATWVGGTPVATAATPNIPWYSGWSRGGIEMSESFGQIGGSVVYSSNGFPVTGAVVYADIGELAAPTQPTGSFLLQLVWPGNASVTVGNLPPGCSAPTTVATVAPGGTASVLPIQVTCS